MKAENNQFDVRLKELNINHYSLPDQQLERIQAFIDEFGSDGKFELNRVNVNYLKADAYFNLHDHEEALRLFYELYEDESHFLRMLIAQRIAEQLVGLKREDEALVLIAKSLTDESDITDKLFFLFWAVTNIENTDAKLEQYSGSVDEISDFMGLVVPPEHAAFSAKITFLRSESLAANRRYHGLMTKIQGLPVQVKIEALEAYIKEEVITQYIGFATESLKNYTG